MVFQALGLDLMPAGLQSDSQQPQPVAEKDWLDTHPMGPHSTVEGPLQGLKANDRLCIAVLNASEFKEDFEAGAYTFESSCRSEVRRLGRAGLGPCRAARSWCWKRHV